MQRTTRRMKVVCVLASGSMLFQLGGCGFGPFLRQAELGFAQAVGTYAVGLLIDGLAPANGPGPFCIGPGCGSGGTGPG